MKSNNKTWLQKIKYGIGEIILVSIGILIAFEVENYREYLNKKEGLVNKLESILIELDNDLTSLNNAIIGGQQNIHYLNLVSEKKVDSVDLQKAFAQIAVNIRFDDHSFSYQELTTSGLFNLIKSDSLKESLKNYYGDSRNYLIEMADYHKKTTISNIEPKLLELMPLEGLNFATNEQVVRDLILTGKLSALVNFQKSIRVHALKYTYSLQRKNRILNQEIKSYLKQL